MYLFKSIRAVVGLSPAINYYRLSPSKVLVRGIDKCAEYAVDLGPCLEPSIMVPGGCREKSTEKHLDLKNY